MIDIEMKMFFTKEHNQITVDYAKKIVLKQLFNKVAFNKYNVSAEIERIEVSDLISDLKYYNDSFSALPSHIAIETIEIIEVFLIHITRKDLTSLYFLVFNEEQENYMEEFELNDYDENSNIDFLEQFGRYMAKAIYYSGTNFLKDDLQIYLQDQILSFAEDFECSEIVEDSILI